MEDTITYVNEKLGGIHAYMKTCGLEEWELSQIRVNLLAQAAPKDLLERLRRYEDTPFASRTSCKLSPRFPPAIHCSTLQGSFESHGSCSMESTCMLAQGQKAL